MSINEKPVLQVKNLCVRYGDGCPKCKTHLEKTDVQFVVLYGPQMIFHSRFSREKYLALWVRVVRVNQP